MSPLVALLLVSLVSSAAAILTVDPADSSQGASSGLQTRDKRAVDSVELQANIFDLATKKDLDELRSWATARLSALTDLQTVTSQLQSALTLSGSSVYTRWGSETCSNISTQVYAGVIGGGNHDKTGSSANALCLSMSPVYDGHNPTTYLSNLYGMEYETIPEEKQDQDGVCSVCRVHRSTTLMIPGTNVCPHGWILEYSGYLMGGFDNHPTSSEYICMDKKQDARHGSHANYDGKLYYYTIGNCGSLPCPPYVQGKIITCVVCSK